MELLPFGDYVASLNRKRTAAGVLLRDDRSRVLLVETTYKPEWEIPGGAVEAEETPWATAIRELQEELGITRPLGALLVIDHIPTQGVMPEGLAFIFDGGLITEEEVRAIKSTDAEVRSVGLYSPAEAEHRVKATLHRRINAALHAVNSGETVFCETGIPSKLPFETVTLGP
ncbi:NUDIX hydrolase [Amycolatopsis sp. EV170708-02-1]|uniref:NUDIX domain-containing protein n=1 Tax=Amycolatopsis sp. EV170708-02-1 TaxID=2919322 RepID=UPI001F0B8D00|nr:NUDIX hydrolase [Amycolatopsis sp. EV170708-02-1]UMP01193.1 NUDIX hydrolase [Amycolatopsis sp. EV170708-02-1]